MRKHSTKELLGVENFNLEKYSGKWYEIARTPNAFERGLADITAVYHIKANGEIEVENRGVREGKVSKIVGRAFPISRSDIGELWVVFFKLIRSRYKVILLDSEYQWAVVTSIKKNLLWFLARTPHIEHEILEKMKLFAKQKGFDVEIMIYVSHSKRESGS